MFACSTRFTRENLSPIFYTVETGADPSADEKV